jgi:hypothetical protein
MASITPTFLLRDIQISLRVGVMLALALTPTFLRSTLIIFLMTVIAYSLNMKNLYGIVQESLKICQNNS